VSEDSLTNANAMNLDGLMTATPELTHSRLLVG